MQAKRNHRQQATAKTQLRTTITPTRTAMNKNADYDARAQLYGFIRPSQLKDLLEQKQSTMLLDVRTDQEIEESGRFECGDHAWVHQPCTLNDTKELEDKSAEFFPNKQTPIVVYCKSGRRASKAKEALELRGYSQVYNAGGYGDLI
mmetsp:Transcript_11699/g.33724  ORF Transcript_11699/g.33724 Transcript_11699/m.33724 type:complete len:147 (+) Transcript_11699:126-566(+)